MKWNILQIDIDENRFPSGRLEISKNLNHFIAMQWSKHKINIDPTFLLKD